MRACSVTSFLSDSATLWTVAHQAPLSKGFPRQEHWSGLPFPSPGDLPNPGIEPTSPALQADSLSLSHQGGPLHRIMHTCEAASVISNSLRHMDCSPPGSSVHRYSPSKNTGVGCHALLQGTFPTQGSNPGLPHCRWILYRLNHQGSPLQC